VKFTDVFLWIVLLSTLIISANYSFKTFRQLEEKSSSFEKKVESTEFISKSFRKACSKEGFTSLNQWQKTCKALWKLEYIAWAEAEDFMDVSESEKGTLMYGKWSGNYGSGEIFCRKKS